MPALHESVASDTAMHLNGRSEYVCILERAACGPPVDESARQIDRVESEFGEQVRGSAGDEPARAERNESSVVGKFYGPCFELIEGNVHAPRDVMT